MSNNSKIENIKEMINEFNSLYVKKYYAEMKDNLNFSDHEELKSIKNEEYELSKKVNEINFIEEILSSKEKTFDLKHAKDLISRANHKRFYDSCSAFYVATFQQLNSSKNRGKPNFSEYTPSELLDKAIQELEELRSEIEKGGSEQRIFEEAGDVGAYITGILSHYLYKE